jgi:Holliday junction resolvasome RuvABC endonuclease subunit
MAKVARVQELARRVTTLAIDPGFGEMGFAVVRYERGMDHVLEMGAISTKPAKGKVLKTEDQFSRLRYTNAKLWQLCGYYDVDALAFESLSIPQQTSKQSAIKIGHPYGSLAMLAVALDLACVMITPQALKKALCGASGASKQDVQAAVVAAFGEHPGVKRFAESTAKTRRNHGYDALAAYMAAGHSDVMKALKRGA